MRTKNWKFYYKETEYKPLLEKIIDTITLWCIIGLFWLSFYKIVEETFPEFVPKLKGVFLIVIIWLFVLWLMYEVIIPRVKKGKIRLQILVPGINVILFLGIFLKNTVKISGGLLAIVSIYLKKYNSYYGASYPTDGGNWLYASFAFLWVTCILWFLLWNLAYGLKKKWILIAFPVIPVMLQLYVGLSPKGIGVSFLFVGALLMLALQTGGRPSCVVHRGKKSQRGFLMQKIFVKGVVIFLILLSLLLSNVFYKDEMTILATKKQEALKLQEELWNSLTSFNLIEMVDIRFNREKLNNNTPTYTGRKVLTITLEKSPHSNVYLKGYQGTVYEDSVWLGDYSYFTQACRQNDSSPEEASKALFQSLYEQMPHYDIYSSSIYPTDSKGMGFSIKYQQNSNVAYVPYFSDYQSLDEEYTLKGDFLVQKIFTDKTISGVCINPTPIFHNMIQARISKDSNSFSLDEYQWYNDVAIANNRKVPLELENFFDNFSIKTTVLRGVSPIETANSVKNYLRSMMLYSLDLDELPEGADPIIYALSESGEGYCMHFASAGTMILRYLGIPARYVSGYVAPAKGFQPVSGKYVYEVKDWNAHAWVEIYMEDLGWIPVEMTPGYEGTEEKLPTEPVTEDTETESETESQETESESESETESQTESESETQDTETEPSENTQGDTAGTEQQTGEDGMWGGLLKWLGLENNAGIGQILGRLFKKIREEYGEVLKGLVLLLLATVLGYGIYRGFKRWRIHYHLVLQRAIEKKNTRRAIKYIHRRIYAYLRIRKGMFAGRLRDKEMEEFLISTFTQVSKEEWKQYMEIAKKMHYSKEELTEEEMMHCYRCYQIVSKEIFKEHE